MPQGKERRRHQRVIVKLPIKIEYAGGKVKTHTKNISILGTYIQVGKKLSIGTELNIKVTLPEIMCLRERQLNCTGVVFRSQQVSLLESKEQYGIGIFFRAFAKKGEKHLNNYIDKILRQENKAAKIFTHRRKRKIKKGG